MSTLNPNPASGILKQKLKSDTEQALERATNQRDDIEHTPEDDPEADLARTAEQNDVADDPATIAPLHGNTH